MNFESLKEAENGLLGTGKFFMRLSSLSDLRNLFKYIYFVIDTDDVRIVS